MTDPNTALAGFRSALDRARSAGECAGHEERPPEEYDAMQEALGYAVALDEWLSRGGFFPSEWCAGRGSLVRIPDDVWEPVGSEDNPAAQLLATIIVNGTSLHLDAVAVTNEDGLQAPAEGGVYSEDDLDAVQAAVGADGHFETLTIRGRDYVLVGTPFC